jgi:hypothetical protein
LLLIRFTEWAREFGDIFSVSTGSIFTGRVISHFIFLQLMLGPNVVVVLTSMKAVKEVK